MSGHGLGTWIEVAPHDMFQYRNSCLSPFIATEQTKVLSQGFYTILQWKQQVGRLGFRWSLMTFLAFGFVDASDLLSVFYKGFTFEIYPIQR